jgi:hypothetical protein
MRRFLITSPSFTGEAELVYNTNETLIWIDMSKTNMAANLVTAFKNKVPANVQQLAAAFADTMATVVEADYEVSFEMLWLKYDKKINRKRCEPLWNKLSKTEQVRAFNGIDAYNKFLKREGWRSKADPETYLRNQYWLNEYK